LGARELVGLDPFKGVLIFDIYKSILASYFYFVMEKFEG